MDSDKAEVSKRWRELFLSGAIIKRHLRETLTSLDLDLKDMDVAIRDANSYFQWQYRLRSGRPIKRIFLPWSTESGHSRLIVHEINYSSRRLCYRSFHSHNIHILNLETGERSILPSVRTINMPDFASTYGRASSDRYLVEVVREPRPVLRLFAVVTVWNMHTSQSFLRNFPGDPLLFSLVKNTFVIACGWPTEGYDVYVWDLASNLSGKLRLATFRILVCCT